MILDVSAIKKVQRAIVNLKRKMKET